MFRFDAVADRRARRPDLGDIVTNVNTGYGCVFCWLRRTLGILRLCADESLWNPHFGWAKLEDLF